MDDKLFDSKEDNFFQKIGEAEKFGIIEEEEKENKKTINGQKKRKFTLQM